MATRKRPFQPNTQSWDLNTPQEAQTAGGFGLPSAGGAIDPGQVQGGGPAPVAVPPPAAPSSSPLGQRMPATLPTGDQVGAALGLPPAGFDLSGSQPDWPTDTGTPGPTNPGGTPPNNPPQTPEPPTTTSGTGDAVWAAPKGEGWTPDLIKKFVNKYFEYRGVSPFDTSPDYWAKKYFEWNDPDYWWMRLNQADEFGGGHQENWGGGTSGDLFGMDINSLIQSLLGMGGTSVKMPALPNFNSPDMARLRELLYGLAESGGQFNKDIINRRVEGARTDLDRNRKSQLDSLRAGLAERGLLGQGPETSGMYGLEEELASRLNQEVSDIYAGESRNADARMMQALGELSGLTAQESANLAAAYNAQTSRYSVDVNAATAKLGQMLDYILGLGGLGIQNSRLQLDADLGYGGLNNDSINQLLEALRLLYGGAAQGQGGYR